MDLLTISISLLIIAVALALVIKVLKANLQFLAVVATIVIIAGAVYIYHPSIISDSVSTVTGYVTSLIG